MVPNKQYHFIGIGGIGMSAIAKLLLCRGLKVSGSDLSDSKIIQDLKRLGAQVFIGHNPANISGADLVIYSTAVRQDNPEFVEAQKNGIALIRRAEALAKLMEDKVVITVTGSHGKTTTSSLASRLLIEAGLNPSLAVGGILKGIDTNASFGEGKFFVAEADESDGSFLHYRPDYSIITNIDYEHLDYYNNFQNELRAFSEFVGQTKEDGCVIACYDDVNLRNIVENSLKRRIFFGFSESAQIFPKNISFNGLSSEFDCYSEKKLIDRFYLPLGGRHNISNSLSVIALGLELGIDRQVIKSALVDFKGAGRRIEVKYKDENYLIIDDYAHHPTEIKATLSAIKGLGVRRLVAVFQPHRYTRTKLLMDEFAASFDLADSLIITDIYPASEPPIAGISGRSIYELIKKRSLPPEVNFLPKQEIVKYLLDNLQPGDLVVTLGAGDIIKVCDELVEEVKRKSKA